VSWKVDFQEDFALEFEQFRLDVQSEIFALAALLEQFGPALKRPHCDTLKSSKYTNMKELRFSLHDGEWRIAFAFDPERSAILLVGGSKSGVPEARFYRTLIHIADKRFGNHVERLGKDVT